MDQKQIDTFVITNQKYLPKEKIVFLKQKLANATDDQCELAASVEFKDPTTVLILSIFLGVLGVDRFMIGDIGIGILKLLTAGCCGILTIIDWFTIQKKTKELNYNNLVMTL